MTDIRRELLAAFDAEHRDHVAVIRAALGRAAEGAPIDLKDVFRRAHSLKGAARAVDMPAVEEIAHGLESFFAALAEGRVALGRPERGAIEFALDAVEGHVAALNRGEAAPPLDAAAAALAGALEPGRPPPPAPAAPPEAAEAAAPAGEAATAGDAAPAGDVPLEYLRVSSLGIDELNAALTLLGVEVAAEEGLAGRLVELERGARALAADLAALRLGRGGAGGGAGTGQRLREIEAGLTAHGRGLLALARDDRRRRFALDRAATRLAEAVRRISLVSVESVFGPFGRMLRDLGRETGIELGYRASGLDLMVDRRVLQDLKDAVLHGLRNAVGHGGEPPEVRLAAGKPAALSIALSVAVEHGRLVVTIEDDGSGLDLDRIEATARAAGLLAPGEPAAPDRLAALVFEPGFSTARDVGRLSGRGMGLSVVAEAARAARGRAELRRREPWGTVLTIEVALASAVQSVVVVEAAGAFYGLAGRGTERLLRLPAAALHSSEGRPVVWIESGGRHVMVPVVALASLLGPSMSPIPLEAGFAKLVVVRRGEERLALAVDGLHAARAVTVESVAAFGPDPALVSGAILVDGTVPAALLDPDGLIARARSGLPGQAAAAEALPAQTERPTILVVDDSITTRTLEKSILEAQGYRVLLSVDGLDALGVLRSGTLVDLVVADVEMPRMDGFALLQTIRNDPRFAALPVVLMTSRAAAEDVRRGLDLGANAYVTKQKFDQRELLATIGQLL